MQRIYLRGQAMPIKDPFDSLTPGLTSPAIGGFEITPDDDVDLPTLPRAIVVGEAGTVAVTFGNGTSVQLPLTAGVIYPIRAQRVLATGTTATGITGLY
jgi:hypothetical protein